MILNHRSQIQNTLENPYRIFFPIGLLGAFGGLILVSFPINSERIFWHKEVMITLFLFPVATGFLFTALPRFLNSKFTTLNEIIYFSFLYICLFIFFLQNNLDYFIFFKNILSLSLFLFILYRYIFRKANPPIFFSFILIFSLISIFSGVLQIFIHFYDKIQLLNLYSSIYYRGAFWILLFGVGVKFFPMLTLSVPLSPVRKYNILNPQIYNSKFFWWIISILFALSFVIEGLGYHFIADFIKSIFIAFFCHEAFYLFFPAQRKGYYTFFIKLFLYSILFLPLLLILFDDLRVHIYHILFINGFLGLVLIVLGRVIISHEKLDLSLEIKSKVLFLVFGLIFVAMLTRVSAIFIKNYQSHLIYAALTAILGVFILVVFVIYLIQKKYQILNRKIE